MAIPAGESRQLDLPALAARVLGESGGHVRRDGHGQLMQVRRLQQLIPAEHQSAAYDLMAIAFLLQVERSEEEMAASADTASRAYAHTQSGPQRSTPSLVRPEREAPEPDGQPGEPVLRFRSETSGQDDGTALARAWDNAGGQEKSVTPAPPPPAPEPSARPAPEVTPPPEASPADPPARPRPPSSPKAQAFRRLRPELDVPVQVGDGARKLVGDCVAADARRIVAKYAAICESLASTGQNLSRQLEGVNRKRAETQRAADRWQRICADLETSGEDVPIRELASDVLDRHFATQPATA